MSRLESLRRSLCSGDAVDPEFDELYPGRTRAVAGRFWTPLGIARRAATLFEKYDAARILDVGAGPGKFCIAAALAYPAGEFTGIEHRAPLVEVARELALELRVPNARFYVGDATQIRWSDFDGFYFYNPFAENIFIEEHCFDTSVELSDRRFLSDLLRTEDAMASARLGTCLVTYHRFGGRIPACYELMHAEQAGTNWLRLWMKTRDDRGESGWYFEFDEGVVLRPRTV